MIKKYILQGILTGLIATGIGYIYISGFYQMIVDFSEVVNVGYLLSHYLIIALAYSFVGILLALINNKSKLIDFIFNIIISVSAFILVFVVLKMNEPIFKNEETNLFLEYYKGFIMPLLFFPALTWFSISPFFKDR